MREFYEKIEMNFRLVVVITNAQIHSTKPELGSAQVQSLLVACRRFAIVRISDNGSGWK